MPPGDVAALAGKLEEVLGDPDRLARMSARNLEKAWQYRGAVTRARRAVFYRHVERMTTRWLHTRARRANA